MQTKSSSSVKAKHRILVIRRDNIGDLILTTPLIHALRQRLPEAWIGALVNSYNVRVLDANPDLDEVFVYTKAKHRGSGSALSAYWSTLSLIIRLRQLRVDYAILASPAASSKGQMFARRINARTIVGFGESAQPEFRLKASPASSLHEVEEVFRIARFFHIEGPAPKTALFVKNDEIAQARNRIIKVLPMNGKLIGIHISARKPKQRWPAQRFVELLRKLSAHTPDLSFVLLWSPGAPDNPTHPGDDAKAKQILQQLDGVPVAGFPTPTLSDLFAGLAVCEQIICSDGGAMHAAAALGKPILCFFGDSDARKWHPWGVPYRLLQSKSEDVADIPVCNARAQFTGLQEELAGMAKSNPRSPV
jgi:heptosyltransferase-3